MTDATLSPEFLARINEAITDEFEKNSRLRKILPAEVDIPGGRYGVVVPRVKEDREVLSASTETLIRPVTLTREFVVSTSQLEDLDLVLGLARHASRGLSATLDQVIAFGMERTDTQTEADCLFPKPPNTVTPFAGSVRDAVVAAVKALEHGGFHPPYAAALSPEAWSAFLIAEERTEKATIFGALQSTRVAPTGRVPPRRWNRIIPHLAVWPCDPMLLDLAMVRRPWAATRGYDENGRVRCVIELQALLRIKHITTENATITTPAISTIWAPPGNDPDTRPDGSAQVQQNGADQGGQGAEPSPDVAPAGNGGER